MVYHFAILSDEVDDFRREIDIDGEATFLDLQDVILKSCGYKADQMTSFFTCTDTWERDEEITMVDMNDESSRHVVRVMERTHLDDTLGQKAGAKLVFVFDPMCDRCLYIQLKSVEEKRHLLKPEVTVSNGKAPRQTEDFDKYVGGLDETTGDMYGDEDFDPDELDADGFQDLEDIEGASAY